MDRELLQLFVQVHGELLTAQYWRGLKQRIEAGEVLEVVPYHLHLAPARLMQHARPL